MEKGNQVGISPAQERIDTAVRLGKPEEVDDYCRRLIREVGSDGGFILSSGCDVPIDAKPGNVKAMLESVQRHGRYPIRVG
jgi:uroporphyrinogen-III decarboxylase